MVAILHDDAMERVGRIDMRIGLGERTRESDERWARRSEALAAWLLDEWKRRQREIAERN
jgi:hypothetical protein